MSDEYAPVKLSQALRAFWYLCFAGNLVLAVLYGLTFAASLLLGEFNTRWLAWFALNSVGAFAGWVIWSVNREADGGNHNG